MDESHLRSAVSYVSLNWFGLAPGRRRIVVRGLWSEDLWSGFVSGFVVRRGLWSDGTGTLLRVVNRPAIFRGSIEARTPKKIVTDRKATVSQF